MGNYHSPIRYHSAKICAEPFPSFSFSPHLSPGSFFPLSEVSSVCHQVALDVSVREFWSLHCRERCGDQVSRTPAIPNSPQSQMDWPQRPLRKKKIEESSSLQWKSKVKWQPNSTSSVPAGKRATGKLCRSPGSYTITVRHGTMAYTLAGSPEDCWWGRNAPRSLHGWCHHFVSIANHSVLPRSMTSWVAAIWVSAGFADGQSPLCVQVFSLVAVKLRSGRETWAVSWSPGGLLPPPSPADHPKRCHFTQEGK